MLPVENDQLTPLVSRIMRIEDVTWGEQKQGFIVRYRGRIYNEDTPAAYDDLAQALRPLEITPLFRLEEGRHAVILVEGVVHTKPSKKWVNVVLFILTVFSVMLTGALFSPAQALPSNPVEGLRFVLSGWPFAAALLAILTAHEFGHYLVGRYHKTDVTLPYFIPFPFSYFGTMGAFIQLKEPPKNRRTLLDIGIAGPLAGLVVAIPVLILGLALSPVQQIPLTLPEGQIFEGNSILYLLLKYLVHGQMLPQPAGYSGLQPAIYWLRYFFTGAPLPTGGYDVSLHPVAWAGWAGLLVTALNLIPAGQLDGGHVLYVLLGGKRMRSILPIILGALVLLGVVWNGWWLWAFLIFAFGRFHAEPLDQITTLDARRKAVAILGIIVFILVFTPVPLVSLPLF
ncbi:MAG TPA: site-2 protease family protein [Anaerolineales bacterium]|nr:site-2 protease family protein [Anaerolineales bacterium]